MENSENRTYIVTEVCPHCKHEVEIHGWDTDRDGFKAFCPYCGERLMLCDECRHCGAADCDYNSDTDTCRYNPEPQSPSKLCVETPQGTLTATAALDPLHPGISIDLHRPDTVCELPLALVELDAADIVSRIWGNAQDEDYTYKEVHQGVEAFFSTPKRISYEDAKEALKAELFMRGTEDIENILEYPLQTGEDKDVIDNRLDSAIAQMDLDSFWLICGQYGIL